MPGSAPQPNKSESLEVQPNTGTLKNLSDSNASRDENRWAPPDCLLPVWYGPCVGLPPTLFSFSEIPQSSQLVHRDPTNEGDMRKPKDHPFNNICVQEIPDAGFVSRTETCLMNSVKCPVSKAAILRDVY